MDKIEIVDGVIRLTYLEDDGRKNRVEFTIKEFANKLMTEEEINQRLEKAEKEVERIEKLLNKIETELNKNK